MRNDQKPWNDKNVRVAMALALNRPEISQALFKGYAQLGNDSPFAPIFRSTDPNVPQRVQDLDKAKQLLSDAGYPNGFTTDLYAEIYQEISDLAQIVKEAAAAINITINLTIEDQQSDYYGDSVYGKSDWLDGPMSLVDYGHRGVPNVFLNAPLKSDGTWNAAHFKNPQYDKLVNQYVAAHRSLDPAQVGRADPDAAAGRDPADSRPTGSTRSACPRQPSGESSRPAWGRSSSTAQAPPRHKHHDVPVAACPPPARSRRTRWRSTS